MMKDAVMIWLNNQAAIWYEENIDTGAFNLKGDYVEKLTEVCAKIDKFSFCIIIITDYLGMAKRSLVYGRPSYFISIILTLAR